MTDETTVTTTEWGVDYHDGCGVRSADEWTASNWVRYWNEHREDEEPATLVCRTVTTTAWTAAVETSDETTGAST